MTITHGAPPRSVGLSLPPSASRSVEASILEQNAVLDDTISRLGEETQQWSNSDWREWSATRVESCTKVLISIAKHLHDSGALYRELLIISAQLELSDGEREIVWSRFYSETHRGRLAWWLDPFDPTHFHYVYDSAGLRAPLGTGSRSASFPAAGIQDFDNPQERRATGERQAAAEFTRALQELIEQHDHRCDQVKAAVELDIAGAWSGPLYLQRCNGGLKPIKEAVLRELACFFSVYIDRRLRIIADYEWEVGGANAEERLSQACTRVLEDVHRAKWAPATNRLGLDGDRSVDFWRMATNVLGEVRGEFDLLWCEAPEPAVPPNGSDTAKPTNPTGPPRKGGRPRAALVNGPKLTQLREEAGLKQESFSEEGPDKVSHDSISRGERGLGLDDNTLQKIARTLSASLKRPVDISELKTTQ